MTISTTSNIAIGQGNGLTTSFSFTFPVQQANQLVVVYTDPLGNQTTLLQSQYSVTGIGSPNGGSVTYPLVGSPIPTSSTLTIERAVAYQQLTSLVNQAGFYPNVVENALDYLTMQTQQLAQEAGLSLNVPLAPVAADLTLPDVAGRANMLVGFDGNGNAIAYPATTTVGGGNMVSEGPFHAGVDFTAGVTTTLQLSKKYGSAANVDTHFDASYQGTDQYSIVDFNIVFNGPIPVGVNTVYVVGGSTFSIGAPANGSVGAAQLAFPITGTTAQRPSGAPDGWSYLDSSLGPYGMPIQKSHLSPTGWVNAAGVQV